jgi:hypothetical protein
MTFVSVEGNNLITSVFLCFQIVKKKKIRRRERNQKKSKEEKKKMAFWATVWILYKYTYEYLTICVLYVVWSSRMHPHRGERGRKGSRRRSSSSSSRFCSCCEDRRWIWKEVVVENFNFSAKILLQGLLNLFIYFVSVRDPKLESVQLRFVGGLL